MTNRRAKILVDTDAIYALIVDGDSHHNTSADLIKKYSETATFFLLDYVLAEAATLLSRRIGKNTADKFIVGYSDYGFRVVNTNKRVFLSAQAYFLKQATKYTSFVDCANMAAAKIYKLDRIFSFDKIYEENGFKILV